MKKNSITKNIQLKKFKKPKITKKWISWLNDKEVTRFSDQRLSNHTFKSQNKYLKNKINENKTIFFKVYLNKNEIGIIVLTNINKFHKSCEINYLIGEKNIWNKGVATYIINVVIKYAFKKLKIKKIYTGVYSNNIGSKKALLKNKFKIEGVSKGFYKFNSQKRIDKIFFGLLKK